LAAAHGARVIGLDDRPDASLDLGEVPLADGSSVMNPTVEVYGAETAITLVDNLSAEIDLVVLSPGVPPDSPILAACNRARLPVISEIEFAYRHCSDELPVIAITGTNGKTTTTGLIAHILNGCGITSTPCGNYGLPFSEVVLPGNNQAAITIEVSSFQLEEITSFRPSVSLWLNFAPDHLDRYSGLDEYRDAKLRIFDFQRPEDYAIIREGEGVGDLQAQMYCFSREPNSTAAFRVSEDGELFAGGKAIASLSKTNLRGNHNAENLLAAMAAVNLGLGIEFGEMTEAISTYSPPEHRCEFVRELAGRDFINDSKATNIHALESSLQAFDQPVVLIVGGKQKGLDYSSLPALVDGRARHVVTVGEIASDLEGLLQRSGFHNTTHALDLPSAVASAAALSEQGDVVLFSPGTSSFDMFSSYEQRGDVFRAAVHDLDETVFSSTMFNFQTP